MKRVHVICEGQTEETFVNEILRPHLVAFSVLPIAALVGKPGHKGGTVNTARMTYDIKLRLTQDTHVRETALWQFGRNRGRARCDSARMWTISRLDSAIGRTRKRMIPFFILQSFVAEIASEQALVAGNRELITRFEKKIQATLARIWGGAETPAAKV
jgi:hypothetical protein